MQILLYWLLFLLAEQMILAHSSRTVSFALVLFVPRSPSAWSQIQNAPTLLFWLNQSRGWAFLRQSPTSWNLLNIHLHDKSNDNKFFKLISYVICAYSWARPRLTSLAHIHWEAQLPKPPCWTIRPWGCRSCWCQGRVRCKCQELCWPHSYSVKMLALSPAILADCTLQYSITIIVIRNEKVQIAFQIFWKCELII